jgi:hypothetical protein
MVELFRSWKKKLWKNYLKTKKVPVFEGYLAKQANHWKAFQEYKQSEDTKALSENNKKNADKKKYHHTLGPGGYETVIRPKRISFPEHFCYCFFSNLCVLNTTNMDWRCFQ